MMEDFKNQFYELKTVLTSCPTFKSKSEKSNLYSTLLQLQEHSTSDSSLLRSLSESSHLLLSSMANDISDDDEEIAAQALKCMGFMIYHPSIVTSISGDDVDMVINSLQKVILSTRIKSVCNLGVWCISVQQLNESALNAHIESLVRAIVHALDNPTGSLSTTFEAMQAVIRLVTQANEKMREMSNLWAPPIYRRLVSTDKREKDMSERCLSKIKSTICPPPTALSKAVIVDVKKKLLPALEELLKQGMKIQVMHAWGWFTRLIGPYAMKNKHLTNQLLKVPEQTFTDSDPQVKIASLIAWEALIDALIILPTQQLNEEIDSIFEANGLTKSIKLIMTPLTGVMSSKCDLSVHSSCMNTWNYLLHKLGPVVNHPSVIKTVIEPMLEVVFRSRPDTNNTWSWNFCVDLINSYALTSQTDVKHYPISFMRWNISQFDFFTKMVHVLISHGAYDDALKIFRSSLKGVQFNVTRSSVPFSEIMTCVNTIITSLKKISEGGIGQTFFDFVKIATEELQPSILGSPLYKLKLDSNLTEMNEDGNMVSPVVYLIVLYFHEMVSSSFDAEKLSSYLTLLLGSYDSYETLHTLTRLLHKFLVPNCLNIWVVVANCLKDHIDKTKPDDMLDLVVSRFLAYPFVVFSSGLENKVDVVQIVEKWKSLYVCSRCYESLFQVVDRFLEDYSKVDPTTKTRGYEFMLFCGDVVTCILEQVLDSSDVCRKDNDIGDGKKSFCTKTSLHCAARFLCISYEEAKANPQILDTIARVFSTLVRIVESIHFDEDIIPFVEILSIPLLKWLADHELQHESTTYQLHQLWNATLKSLQNCWPPINFNSTFLKLQANLLTTTLDHPNSSISNPTIAFWNSTYGEQIKLDYPQNLLPVLDKLSRNGKINLCKKRYSRIDATISPPKKHKVTTTLNRCVKRVELVDNVSKRKKLELTEHQKEVRRAQQGKSKDCEGRGPGVRTYTSVDWSQGIEDESQEESQDLRNAESILEMLKRDGKVCKS